MGRRGCAGLTWLALFGVHAILAADRELTTADWERLRTGEIIIKAHRNDGGGSSAWSVALIDHPPELVWRAVCSPQLFQHYIRNIPRSLLLDESTATLVAALGDAHSDVVEGLLRGVTLPDWHHETDGRWSVYSYQRARFPWPLRDRWVVIRIVSDDRTMVQVWDRLVGTMKQDRGSWTVRAAPGGGTLLINEMLVQLPGAAFELLTPMALSVSVRETFRALHAMAADLARATPSCQACPGHPPSR